MLETLARIEREHQSAVAAHDVAKAKERGISDRVNDTAQRMKAISQKRIDGTASAQEAHEYAALAGDLELLKQMHAKAKAETQLQAETMHACFIGYTDAERVHNLRKSEAEYEALLSKTREIEAVFVKAIRATALAGKKVGHFTLTQSFTKSDVLHRALDLGVLPPE